MVQLEFKLALNVDANGDAKGKAGVRDCDKVVAPRASALDGGLTLTIPVPNNWKSFKYLTRCEMEGCFSQEKKDIFEGWRVKVAARTSRRWFLIIATVCVVVWARRKCLLCVLCRRRHGSRCLFHYRNKWWVTSRFHVSRFDHCVQ